ncbi:hypothetical protein FGIG_12585, partial [Fasciola gigantica]
SNQEVQDRPSVGKPPVIRQTTDGYNEPEPAESFPRPPVEAVLPETTPPKQSTPTQIRVTRSPWTSCLNPCAPVGSVMRALNSRQPAPMFGEQIQYSAPDSTHEQPTFGQIHINPVYPESPTSGGVAQTFGNPVTAYQSPCSNTPAHVHILMQTPHVTERFPALALVSDSILSHLSLSCHGLSGIGG